MTATTPIKIFIDGHSFDREYQGTHIYIRELYRALSMRHPDVELYIGAENTVNIRRSLPFIAPANILPYKNRIAGISRFVFDIPRYIRKHRFDFAHFQFMSPRSSPGCRYIVTLHDVLYNDLKRDFPVSYRLTRNILFRNSYRRASIKTTVSGYSGSRIEHHYGVPVAETHLLHGGVPADFGNGISGAEAKQYIHERYGLSNYLLLVSRIEPRKNHLLLLQAYLRLRLHEKGIPLVFIGRESIPVKALEQLYQSLPAATARMVVRLPAIDPHEMPAFYKACRAFVYPSRGEGLGVPPLEAALCMAPVLCSSVTAMSAFDFFEPFRFDPADEDDFVLKLSRILDAPPGEAALQHVADTIKERFCWNRTADAFYKLLKACP
ncbi:MAG TPA: glycosyltransferase family 1 protein [Flavisolibacter sp.]